MMDIQDIESVIADLDNRLGQGQAQSVLDAALEWEAQAPDRAEFSFLAAKALLRCGRKNDALYPAFNSVAKAPFWLEANSLVLILIANLVDPRDRPARYMTWQNLHGDSDGLTAACEKLPRRYDMFAAWAALEIMQEHDEHALDLFGRCLTPATAIPRNETEIKTEYADYAYDDNAVHRVSVDRIADYLQPCLSKGSTIIDAGCGSGLAGKLLRPYAEQLIGVDISPHMAERTRQTGLYDQVLAADMIGTLEAMPQSADVVVSLGCVYYLADLTPFLRAARQALKPGGRLLMIDHPAPAGRPVMQTIDGTLRYCRSADLTEALAAAAGFHPGRPMMTIYFNLPAFFWDMSVQ